VAVYLVAILLNNFSQKLMVKKILIISQYLAKMWNYFFGPPCMKSECLQATLP